MKGIPSITSSLSDSWGRVHKRWSQSQILKLHRKNGISQCLVCIKLLLSRSCKKISRHLLLQLQTTPQMQSKTSDFMWICNHTIIQLNYDTATLAYGNLHHVTPCFSISGHPCLWALMGPWYFQGCTLSAIWSPWGECTSPSANFIHQVAYIIYIAQSVQVMIIIYVPDQVSIWGPPAYTVSMLTITPMETDTGILSRESKTAVSWNSAYILKN